jgi:hypothetical protein
MSREQELRYGRCLRETGIDQEPSVPGLGQRVNWLHTHPTRGRSLGTGHEGTCVRLTRTAIYVRTFNAYLGLAA